MILTLDFGGQYAKLIWRRMRELGVKTQLIPWAEVPTHRPGDLEGIILSGGPSSVTEEVYEPIRRILEWGVPVLGICFGHQALVQYAGGEIATQAHHEYARATLRLVGECPLTAGLPAESAVWMSHGDTVSKKPEGWEVIGTTLRGVYAALMDSQRQIYTTQFHPEVIDTEHGAQLLENFVLNICQAKQGFAPPNLAEEAKRLIQGAVGPTGHVLVACSLGVDSTTVALLATQALGAERVHPVFVDNGLQRQEDLDLVEEVRHVLPNLMVVEAADTFLNALVGEADPRRKRIVIGSTFWQVFWQTALDLQQRFPISTFIQGTIGPDAIESGGESPDAEVTTLHHNLVAPPPSFTLKVLEPLRDYFKDQVRGIAREIGVPEVVVRKHPFPGPGLAVRALGEVTRERIELVRQCDAIFIHKLQESGWYESVSQAYAGLLQEQVKCVGGDKGGRGHVVVLRAVVTVDFMTARAAALPHELVEEVVIHIMNEVPGVARVMEDKSPKPRGMIELE